MGLRKSNVSRFTQDLCLESGFTVLEDQGHKPRYLPAFNINDSLLVYIVVSGFVVAMTDNRFYAFGFLLPSRLEQVWRSAKEPGFNMKDQVRFQMSQTQDKYGKRQPAVAAKEVNATA